MSIDKANLRALYERASDVHDDLEDAHESLTTAANELASFLDDLEDLLDDDGESGAPAEDELPVPRPIPAPAPSVDMWRLWPVVPHDGAGRALYGEAGRLVFIPSELS